MTPASPYNQPERAPQLRTATTIWADGEVLRREPNGSVRVLESVPPVKQETSADKVRP